MFRGSLLYIGGRRPRLLRAYPGEGRPAWEADSVCAFQVGATVFAAACQGEGQARGGGGQRLRIVGRGRIGMT